MIFKFEKKLLVWANKNVIWLVTALVTVLSLLVRLSLWGVVSADASLFLLPWYDEIAANGGLGALREQVGDYNILYQTLIALFTYFPIKPLWAYKLLSVAFDYLLAFCGGCFIFFLTDKDKTKGLLAYCTIILYPLVCLNSAAWAQCDSIYTFFCILSLFLLFREKYLGSFIALGIAFAFKLQTVFLFPFFLFVYFYQKRYSILYFLSIPVVTILLNLGGIINGRSIADVFLIYANQTNEYHGMWFNCASFWLLLDKSNGHNYGHLHWLAVCLTIGLLAVLMTLFIKKNIRFTPASTIEMALLLSYTCVFFLPNMHDRYDYLYLILGILLVFLDRKTLPLLIGISMISLQLYGHFLFGAEYNLKILAVVNLICYFGYCIHFFAVTAKASACTGAQIVENRIGS